MHNAWPFGELDVYETPQWVESWFVRLPEMWRIVPIWKVTSYLGWAPRSLCGQGFDRQGLQHVLVHIRELLDVEATLSGRIFAECFEQRRSLTKAGHPIQNSCGLTRRECNNRQISLPTALVLVVVATEAND